MQVSLAEVRPAEVRLAEDRPAEVRPMQVSIAEFRPAEVRLAEVRPLEGRRQEVRPAEVRLAKVRPVEARIDEERILEVRTTQVRLDEAHLSEILVQVCLAEVEVRPAEERVFEIGAAELGPAEVRPTEVRRFEICLAEVRPFEIRPADVRMDIGVLLAPRVPGSHPLPKLSDVIVVRHASSSPRLPTARHHLARLVLDVDLGERLSVVVPHHEACRVFFDRPRWREAARLWHQAMITAP